MQIIKRIKDMKVSRKMILVYLIFASITCLVSVLALQISYNIFDEELYQNSIEELEFFIEKVNVNLDEIETMSFNVALDESIQLKIEEIRQLRTDGIAYDYQLFELRKMFVEKLEDIDGVQNIIYTDSSDIMFLIGIDRGGPPDGAYDALIDRFEGAKGGYIMEPPMDDYNYMLSGRDILQNTPQITLEKLGSIIITTDIGGVIENEKSSLKATNSSLSVFSEKGIVFENESNIPIDRESISGNQGYRIIREGGQKYFQCFLKSSETGWIYMNAFPYSEVYGKTMTLRYMVIGVFILLFIGMVFLMEKMTQIITKPLVQLNESIKIVSTGDFEGAKGVIDTDIQRDEIGMLAREFNTMLEKIDILIHENYKKQLLIKDTKYKMLQAQINPHFLYNTLNAINWMVKAERNKDAVKMIMRLGELLRASFAEDPYISVYEEVEVARSYMTIQKYRYGNRIEFSVETEGDLDIYKMPRMILQPLIENAIYYGAEQMPGVCYIHVIVREEKTCIYLEISDTGMGMSEDELELVRSFNFVPKGHGIGLMNIRERLSISFNNHEFLIDSQSGQGTSIRIRIPKDGKDSYV